MLYIPSLLTISMLYLVAAVSPGPSFFVISQLSLSGNKAHATQVALGIATGSVIWAVLAMVGVSALLGVTEWLSMAVRFIGVAYLIWLGLKVLKRAFFFSGGNDEPINVHMSLPRAWRTGLLTSLTNPKSGAFWTSVFATTVPVAAPIWFYLITVLMIAVLSFTWHLGLARVFTSQRVRNSYADMWRYVDALSGCTLIGFGLGLALSQ